MKVRFFWVIGMLSMIIGSCEKKLNLVPAVQTGEIINSTAKHAIVKGTIIDLGYGINEHGHCFGKSSEPTIAGNKTKLGKAVKLVEFTSELENLDPGATYNVRAYVTSGDKTYYGKNVILSTKDGKASVTTNDVISNSINSVICGGEVTDDGGAAITERGVCWGTSPNPTNNDYKTIDGSGEGIFESIITDLILDTTYYVRAYATNSVDTYYGLQEIFTTDDGIVSLTSSPVINISENSATCGGNITDDGGSEVTARGVCWGTNSDPDLTYHTVDGNGTGLYSSNITGLNSNTTYYARAYATNAIGTYYGTSVPFTTKDQAGDVVLTTLAITDILMSSASSGGIISDDGGSEIILKGVCWSTQSDPTLSDNMTEDGFGSQDYTSIITGLGANMLYHVKAYVLTNDSSIYYGNQQSFITRDGVIELSTTAVTGLTNHSATSGGTITDDGGAAVTVKGLCWSKSPNPTINNSKSVNGSGTGSFTFTIVGLDPNTTYYVKAYATNDAGTRYGSERTFTTPGNKPIVSTQYITSVTRSSATSGGDVTDNGGASVTEKGICWSTSPNPTTSSNKTADGSGTGSYVSSLSNLNCNTTYYVKAYATNSFGTGYGEERVFVTNQCLRPAVTSYSISDIEVNSAIGGGIVTSDGGASILARGMCWSTSPSPTISDSKTIDGTGMGSFTSTLTNLNTYVVYYVRAYATNSAGTSYGDQVIFRSSTVTDIDGNQYRIVKIGSQTWMAENLKTSKYADGSNIPLVENDTQWENSGIGDKAYCWHSNNLLYKDSYGALYNWGAAMNGMAGGNDNPSGIQGVCPSDWHLPSDNEWIDLFMELGMSYSEANSTGNIGTSEGGKLKETGTEHWIAPNVDANNSSGFSARPGGTRDTDGSFYSLGTNAVFWSTTEFDSELAWDYKLANSIGQVNRNYYYKKSGFSVRCIKD